MQRGEKGFGCDDVALKILEIISVSRNKLLS